jgi:hypothetical protein
MTDDNDDYRDLCERIKTWANTGHYGYDDLARVLIAAGYRRVIEVTA